MNQARVVSAECEPEPQTCVFPEGSLAGALTRRLRECRTSFGDRVKLVLRQDSMDQWANLPLPYLLVVPTANRNPSRAVPIAELDDFIVSRRIVFRAALDGRGSEAEWMAADDIDRAERELWNCFFNWRPYPHYRPSTYAGMRIQGTKLPDVMVNFEYDFHEEISFVADEMDGEELELGNVLVYPRSDNCGAVYVRKAR